MTELAIATRGLRKRYGRTLAVADLTLEVHRGEAFGLLGPNGAGKSTALKMLLGLARPTSGAGHLLGQPLGDVATRRRVGFLPEHFHFQDWLSGAELLRLHGRLYGMAAERLRRRVPELLERVGLAAEGRKPLRDYSKGMQQRIGLAQALLNDPEVIFLDEPTSGLDPIGRFLVRDIIAEQRRRGVTVFLNSHLLGEVEVSCDRVAFVKAGRILETRELAAEAGAVSVRLRAQGVPGDIWERFGLAAQEAAPGDWRFQIPDEARLPALVRALVEAGAEVFECSPRRASLEELFLNIVGREGGDR